MHPGAVQGGPPRRRASDGVGVDRSQLCRHSPLIECRPLPAAGGPDNSALESGFPLNVQCRHGFAFVASWRSPRSNEKFRLAGVRIFPFRIPSFQFLSGGVSFHDQP